MKLSFRTARSMSTFVALALFMAVSLPSGSGHGSGRGTARADDAIESPYFGYTASEIVSDESADDKSKVPAADLLAYFSATCPSQGEWTRAALGQAQSLMTAFRSIQDDPDCKTVSGAVGELQILNNRIVDLQNVATTQSQVNGLKKQEQDLMLQLSNTSDPALQLAIATQLSTVQAGLVGAMGAAEADQQYARPQQAELLTQVVQSTNTVLSQAINNQSCLMKKPNILPALASLGSSVASAVSTVNPILSMGIAAFTELLGQTIEYFRKRPIARSIRRISDSMAVTAYSCVLESLSSQWCMADDAERVVRMKADARTHPIGDGRLVSAVRLLDREIPAFLGWLDTLRAGNKPANESDAARQQEVFDRDARVRSAPPLAAGTLQQARQIFDSASDNEGRWRVMKKAVNDIYAKFTVVSPFGRNPLSDILQEPFARYFLLGLSETEVPRNSTGVISFDQFDPFTQWPRPGQVFTPNLDIVDTQAEAWADLARQRVSREMAMILQPDALRTLSEAFDSSSNAYKVSARDALRTLRVFLVDRGSQTFANAPFRRIYFDTIEKLQAIEAQIDAISPAALAASQNGQFSSSISTDLTPEQQTLATIYGIANLQYGSGFIRGRMEMAMRLALMQLFASLSPADQNVAAQILASDRFLDVLQRVSGTDNLAVILSDIQKSKPVTQETLQAFANLFDSNIERVLKHQRKQEHDVGGESGRSYRRVRAELCLQLLAVPKWPRQVSQELCDGMQLDPVIAGGPSSVKIDDSVFNKPHNERACSYRDYMRLSKIYQDWHSTPAGG